MPTTTDVDVDHSLDDLWEEGVQALQKRDPMPGHTYEVAPGVIGEMPWPTLEDRKQFLELQEGKQDVFREDVSEEHFNNLRHLADGKRLFGFEDEGDALDSVWAESRKDALGQFVDVGGYEDEGELREAHPQATIQPVPLEEIETPIDEADTDNFGFEHQMAEVNCAQAAALLDYDGQSVEPHDIVPDMAAVISAHFTKVRAGRNGQKTS